MIHHNVCHPPTIHHEPHVACRTEAGGKLWVSPCFQRRRPKLWALISKIMSHHQVSWQLLESKQQFARAAVQPLAHKAGGTGKTRALVTQAEKASEAMACMLVFAHSCQPDKRNLS